MPRHALPTPGQHPFRLVAAALLCVSRLVAHAGTFQSVEDFGPNPGEIRMYRYVPETVPSAPPVVVALHGCGQDAETYAKSGWIDLAERWQVVVIFPQQTRSNNPLGCWNWFLADDNGRGRGEARSVAAMAESTIEEYRADRDRVFVEGFSAGGWMASALLAAYPDLFAAGAIYGGGPAYCASVETGFWDPYGVWMRWQAWRRSTACMGGTDRSPGAWAEAVVGRTEAGAWPRVSVWQGGEDDIVDPSNLEELMEQWTALHGVDREPDAPCEQHPPALRRCYRDADGRVVVETWFLPDVGHAVPVSPQEGCGRAGEYREVLAVCAPRRAGLFWGLGGEDNGSPSREHAK